MLVRPHKRRHFKKKYIKIFSKRKLKIKNLPTPRLSDSETCKNLVHLVECIENFNTFLYLELYLLASYRVPVHWQSTGHKFLMLLSFCADWVIGEDVDLKDYWIKLPLKSHKDKVVAFKVWKILIRNDLLGCFTAEKKII